MIRARRCLAVAGLTLSVSLLGCASGPAEAPTRDYVFIPTPPAPPRLQFLTSFSDARAWTAPAERSLAQWVVGEQRETRPESRFNSPYGIAARHGRLYICDVAADRVHVVDMAAGTYNHLRAGDRIINPVNLTIDDADGKRYLADSGARQVLVFDEQDRFIRAIGDPANWTPVDVAIRGDELYVVDVTGGEIEVWSKDGSFRRAISRKGEGPDELSNPANLAFGPDGRLYVTDSYQQIVKVFSTDGDFMGTVGRPGASIGTFARPKGIAIDDAGTIYVADSQWDVVQVFDDQGRLLLVFGEPGEEPWAMGLPAGLAVDATSVDAFARYLAPGFEAEYLLFVVNQFGKHKIAVYAFGQATDLAPQRYEVDMQRVEQRRRELREQEQEPAQTPQP